MSCGQDNNYYHGVQNSWHRYVSVTPCIVSLWVYRWDRQTNRRGQRNKHLNTIQHLLSWEFNVPFQHKYGYFRDKRSRVEESYPYPVKEGQRCINLNPGRLFVQQPPQRERDWEAHLNYYTSGAPTTGETTITPQDKTKSNTTITSMHP